MTGERGITLGELAGHIGARLQGDASVRVERIATLQGAGPDELSFLSNKKYRKFLATTHAAAVVAGPTDASLAAVPVLVAADPYLAFTRAARLLYPRPPVVGGVHPSAVVDPAARVAAGAWIGPCSVVEAGAVIEDGVFVGPGCVIGRDCEIGADSCLVARVTLCHGTIVGRRAMLHPGAVLGREGFGFARDGERWLRIPQVGRLRLGDDVEVGANTTVDRGALDDTVIGDGAILDNQIQIGHNVHIGDNSAIAACTGISGSTRIGRNCMLAGDVGVAGHLDIGDGVFLAAGSKVNRNLAGPGSYGGVLPVDPDPLWRRNVTRIRQLDDLARRLLRLERRLASSPTHTDPEAG